LFARNIDWHNPQVPHCDGHNCNHLWLRIVTAKSGHNAAGLRKLLKSGFSWLFWNFCDFFSFLRGSAFILQKPSYCEGHKCDHLWRYTVTMKTVVESFKSPSIPGFFVTICDFVYFYTSLPYSTDFLIIGYCRSNNYQKQFCFWWSNITSLIIFGSNSMLLMPNNGSF
jgi:hypothetical protein